MKIEFHADDFGLFNSQTASMKELIDKGAIHGVSVMGNVKLSDDDIRFLSARDDLQISVHLNLIEGSPCCSEMKAVSLLVNDQRMLSSSFLKLLLISLLPEASRKRQKYKKQIQNELEAQIQNICAQIPGLRDNMRLDSHAHYHCIPIVFEALADLICNHKYNVTYLRIPKESFSPYWGSHVRLINVIKQIVLRLCIRNNIRYSRTKSGIDHLIDHMQGDCSFYGVVKSGEMKNDAVSMILDYQKKKHDTPYVEILFHPGESLVSEEIKSLTNEGDRKFWLSPDRRTEFYTLLNIQKNGIYKLTPEKHLR